MNIHLGNQRALHNKTELVYEPVNNVKKFNKIYHDHETPKYKHLSVTIAIKLAMFLFFSLSRKVMNESKDGHPPSYFYRKHHERKMKNMPTTFFCKYDPHKKTNGNTC